MVTFAKKTEIALVSFLCVTLLVAAHFLSNDRYAGALTLIAFLYTPIFVLFLQKKGSESFGFSLNHFFEISAHYRVLGLTTLFTLAPFFLVLHFWQVLIEERAFQWALVPSAQWFFKTTLVQVLLVALPEEFFFRGYFQTRLGQTPFFEKLNQKILGAEVNGGWLNLVITNMFFASVHLISIPNPVRLLTFFPGLVFSYLWSRTRNLAVAILYHAISNILLFALLQCYK